MRNRSVFVFAVLVALGTSPVAARTVVVLPPQVSVRDAFRFFEEHGARVRAAVPPRLLLLEDRPRVLWSGARLIEDPGQTAGLPASDVPVVRRLLIGPPPVQAGPIVERPPSTPSPKLFEGWPRNNLVEYLQGTVVVAVLFAESTGLYEQKTETWDSERLAEMRARIEEGTLRFLDYDPTGRVSFIFHYPEVPGWEGPERTVPCDYEPIAHATWPYFGNETPIWCSVLSHLGYDECPGAPPWDAFLNDLRDFYGADWAFVIRVVDDYNWGMQGGPLSPSHAEILGPGTTVYYSASSAVVTHELGHVFGAIDEYCTETNCPPPWAISGYLGVTNGNATGPGDAGIDSGHGEQAPSLMAFNDVAHVNPYTFQAWGLSDSYGEGEQDVHRTWPRTRSLSVEVLDDGVLSLAGSASVTVLQTLYGKPPGTSVKRIRGVEWRVDGNAWQPAQAADGVFDADVEPFLATTPALPNGIHLVEVRATDDHGFVERFPPQRQVLVERSDAPRMPVFPVLVASPSLASTGMQVVLDASASTDGAHGPLQFRFDADGDGVWDGPPGSLATVSVSAGMVGTHEARVEVLAPDATPAVAVARWTTVAENLPPHAAVRVVGGDRVFGATVPVLRFDGSESFDPEGTSLSFRWLVHGFEQSLDTGFGASPALDYEVRLPGNLNWSMLYLPEKTWINDIVMIGQDLVVTGDADFGIHTVSLADPSTPVLLGALKLPAEWEFGILGLTQVLATTLLACGDKAVWVVDLSDPSAPALIAKTIEAHGPICESYQQVAYVGGGHGLTGLDLGDPTAPKSAFVLTDQKVGLFQPVPGTPLALFQAGSEPVKVLDLSDPLAPVEAGSVEFLNERAVLPSDHRLYAYDADAHVTVLDPFALPDLRVLGEFDLAAGDAPAFATDDSLYVIRDNYLLILDVSDLASGPSTRVLAGPVEPSALIRPVAGSFVLQAVMGFVATADTLDAVFHRSAGVRAELVVRDADGRQATAAALAWANPYNHPPALTVTADPADGKVQPGQPVHFTIRASDPDLGQTWDAYLAWRADLDGDGNSETAWQDLDPSSPVAEATAVFDRPGPRELVFEVRDRFRAFARRVVTIEVSALAAPALTAVDPAISAPGIEEDVVLVGVGLDVPVQSVSFGPGVDVLGVQEALPLSLRVRIRVAPDASKGPRDVVVAFANGQQAVLWNGFAVGSCAIAVDPPGWLVAESSTLLRFGLSGGASPHLEAGGPSASGGTVLEERGIYATGDRPGRDILWARSRRCCDPDGGSYEDCRATRIVVDVVAPPERPVLRGFGGGKGLVIPAGGSAEFPVEVSGVRAPISGVWTQVDVVGGPVWASLRAPSKTEVALGLLPQEGWAPLEYPTEGSLLDFNTQDPRGTWVLAVKNLDQVSAAEVANWQLEIRAPEAAFPFDWMPPAAVTDLTVVFEQGRFVARFTAPADPPDGGPVATLSLRASRDPIQPWTWDRAAEVGQAPIPADPGTPQTCALEGLQPGPWYLAVRSADAMGNQSGLSNVVLVEVPSGTLDGSSGEESNTSAEEPASAEEVVESLDATDPGPDLETSAAEDALGASESDQDVFTGSDRPENDLGRPRPATCGCRAGRSSPVSPGWLFVLWGCARLAVARAHRRAGRAR